MVGSTNSVNTVAPNKPPAMATAIGPQKMLGTKGVIPSIPETQNYVARVMENYRSYKRGGSTSLPKNVNVRQMVTVN